MKTAIIKNLVIQIDLDQCTSGSPLTQVQQAIDLINGVLQREPYGLGAQIMGSGVDSSNVQLGDDDQDKENYELSENYNEFGRQTLKCDLGTFQVRPYFYIDPDEEGVSVYDSEGEFIEQIPGAKMSNIEGLIERMEDLHL